VGDVEGQGPGDLGGVAEVGRVQDAHGDPSTSVPAGETGPAG
jgi:hypothetical protein